mmetsp:Transcript_1983/g.4545  ORF Transcript_1983/g.4545 Transcript_1983/m.4545 type:complete len:228 (-) Transcript_1983:90-773(-)
MTTLSTQRLLLRPNLLLNNLISCRCDRDQRRRCNQRGIRIRPCTHTQSLIRTVRTRIIVYHSTNSRDISRPIGVRVTTRPPEQPFDGTLEHLVRTVSTRERRISLITVTVVVQNRLTLDHNSDFMRRFPSSFTSPFPKEDTQNPLHVPIFYRTRSTRLRFDQGQELSNRSSQDQCYSNRPPHDRSPIGNTTTTTLRFLPFSPHFLLLSQISLFPVYSNDPSPSNIDA